MPSGTPLGPGDLAVPPWHASGPRPCQHRTPRCTGSRCSFSDGGPWAAPCVCARLCGPLHVRSGKGAAGLKGKGLLPLVSGEPGNELLAVLQGRRRGGTAPAPGRPARPRGHVDLLSLSNSRVCFGGGSLQGAGPQAGEGLLWGPGLLPYPSPSLSRSRSPSRAPGQGSC